MERYRLNCKYCDYTWDLDYLPRTALCAKCKDPNITVQDMSKDRIDYYAGTTPYKNKTKAVEEPLKEIKKEEEEILYPYMPSSWD